MHYEIFENESFPTISLNEVLTFIYSINWFEINSSKKTQYIMYWDWFEFKSEKDLKLFYIFLKLYFESAIDLALKEIWNDNNIINNGLKEKLNEYLLKDDRDILTKIIFKIDKEYDFEWFFYNWEEISKIIKKHDWFDISLHINWYSLLYLLFRKITQYKWYSDLNKKLIINELYENISKKIDNDKNSSKRIEIFYEFDNYLENNRLIFPLLKELEENKNLVIDKVVLKENYIHFYLEKFINFKKEVITELSEKIIKKDIIKFEYKNDEFYINNEAIYFDNKNTKIFHLYRFIFDAYIKFNKNHLSYIELEKFFDENSANYLKIKRDFFINYDSKIRKDLQTKNKDIQEKFWIEKFIGIDKSWIWCHYYHPEKS